tara:strand:+ start:447 stop:1286 length:840 start_codon:yes stop_codon:yes gene_type:complete
MGIKNKKLEHNYFHCYATANDHSLYFQDLQNLIRIKNCDSGYRKIQLFIAISEVKTVGLLDRLFMKMIKKMFHNHPSIALKEVAFKNNIGRDFSSFESLFLKVKQIAHSDDYIFFQNRSGHGPFRKHWYTEFVKQFEKFESIAICGSTINFMDHPNRSLSENVPHVQTYSFLTKVFYINMLNDNFPGSKETIKFNIICKGEIAFSQFFLEKKYKITCIEWPNEVISNQSEAIMTSDIKKNVTAKHYFYHRKYLRKNINAIINRNLNGTIIWTKFLLKNL